MNLHHCVKLPDSFQLPDATAPKLDPQLCQDAEVAKDSPAATHSTQALHQPRGCHNSHTHKDRFLMDTADGNSCDLNSHVLHQKLSGTLPQAKSQPFPTRSIPAATSQINAANYNHTFQDQNLVRKNRQIRIVQLDQFIYHPPFIWIIIGGFDLSQYSFISRSKLNLASWISEGLPRGMIYIFFYLQILEFHTDQTTSQLVLLRGRQLPGTMQFSKVLEMKAVARWVLIDCSDDDPQMNRSPNPVEFPRLSPWVCHIFLYVLASGKLTQLWKVAIEIVDFPIQNSDFPQLCQSVPEGSLGKPMGQPAFLQLRPASCLHRPHAQENGQLSSLDHAAIKVSFNQCTE